MDDLGSELTTQFTQSALYELVNTRLVAGRCTVISSNPVSYTHLEKLEGFDGASPKDLARELITQSPQGATDDRTALVIRLEKRRVFDH